MDLDPRLHFVTATAIIVRNRQVSDGERSRTTKTDPSPPAQGSVPEFLITKRAPHEKAFPNKWTVPGGKLVRKEYESLPYKTEYPQWYGMMDWLVRKEVREEAGVEIEKPEYLTDLVFIRPDGFPVVTLSYWAYYKSGEVKLNKEMTEFAWVTAEEAKKYDLIEGIWEELVEVNKLLGY